MISPFVKLYVYKAAHKKEKNYKIINGLLEKELNKYSNWQGKIRYAWFWSAGVHTPNASATIPGLILINAEWAARIIIDNDNPSMHDAFAMTVNHEITHQENDYFYIDLLSPDGRFINWVNEVHADYGGIHKAFNGDYKRAISAMKYKVSCKKREDKNSRSHPSWEQRMKYVQFQAFNDELIDAIAKECRCTNDNLIKSVKDHFDEVILRG